MKLKLVTSFTEKVTFDLMILLLFFFLKLLFFFFFWDKAGIIKNFIILITNM